VKESHVCSYDLNTLPNFVANAPQLAGFDLFTRLADYLLQRAGLGKSVIALE
jgi:hypothetical protein